MKSLSAKTVAVLALSAVGLVGCGDDAEGGASKRLERLGLTTDVPDKLVNACSRAAEKTRLEVVYCPPVVPRGELAIDYATAYRGSPASYGISMRSEGFADRRSNAGHWAIEAASGRSIVTVTQASRSSEERERIRLESEPATIIRVQASANSFHKGHVVVLWRFGGVGYDVSLHGHENAPQARAIARALIRLMKQCPRSPQQEASNQPCQLVVAERMNRGRLVAVGTRPLRGESRARAAGTCAQIAQ